MFETRLKTVLILTFWLIIELSGRLNAEPITVVTEHLPPMQIAKGTHAVGGVATEVVRLMLDKVQSGTRITAINWARAYNMALNQKNIMIFSITRTKQREDLFKWVGAIASFENYLWRKADRQGIVINDLYDAMKYHVAVPRFDMQFDELKRLGFEEGKNLLVTSEYPIVAKLLMRGRVDLLSGNRLFLSEQLKSLNYDISDVAPVYRLKDSTLYIAFSKQTDDVQVETYQKALLDIKQGKRYKEVMQKWNLK